MRSFRQIGPWLVLGALLGVGGTVLFSVGRVSAGGVDEPTSLPAKVGQAAKAASEKAAAEKASGEKSGEKPSADAPKPPAEGEGASKDPSKPPPKKPAPKKTSTSDTTMPTKRPSDHVRGKELYDAMCWQCHGKAGQGDGPAAASLLGGVPTLQGKVVTGDKEDIDRQEALVDVVQNGRGRMPAYAEVVDRADSRRTLVYLRDTFEGRGDGEDDGADDGPAEGGDAPGAEGQ